MAIDHEGRCVASLRLSKASDKEVLEFLGRLPTGSTWAMIEKVHAMPKQGVSSSFKFGMAYGALRMALTAAGIPWREVLPREWQKSCGALTKGKDNQAERKRQLKEVAQQRFPGQKITLEDADGYLIADFARRTNWG